MSRDQVYLLLLSLVLFVPFLGSVPLFDWDEINFAESAREMLLTGNWWQVTINFEPFHEKPPLFFWMQALCMSVFGIGEFAARLPNAICGIITLQVLFHIGLKWHSQTFAWAWVLLYIGSVLPFLYFKSGIIDPWFNLFIFLSVYHLFLTIEKSESRQHLNAAIAGIFSGLAILTKGPVGFLLLFLTFAVWLVSNRFKKPASWSVIALFALCVFLTSSLWFGHETIKNGPWFIVEFIHYQLQLLLKPVAGHEQPFFYHFLVVLLGCFPMSILALSAFSKSFIGDSIRFSIWMKYLFWVVLILFSLVSTKILHYSSMTYLPLSYLAAIVVVHHIEHRSIANWQFIWIVVQGGILAFAFIAFPALMYYKEQWIHFVNDPFITGSLNVDVDWMGIEGLVGLLFVGILLLAWRLKSSNMKAAFLILCLGNATVISLLLILIAPKVEAHSQRSLLAFYEEHSNEDAFFENYKHMSYGQYFYGRVQPESNTEETCKIHYVICKVQHIPKLLAEKPEVKHLYDQGGYSFYAKPK